jgi:hypothetical protein
MKKVIIHCLTRNLLFAFLISCILTSIVIYIFYHKYLGDLAGNTGFSLFIVGGIISCFIQTIISSTVYFNIYERVRNNSKLSLLSFFLLPFLFTFAVILFNHESEMTPLFSALTIPFILSQILFYVDFKKKMSAQ